MHECVRPSKLKERERKWWVCVVELTIDRAGAQTVRGGGSSCRRATYYNMDVRHLGSRNTHTHTHTRVHFPTPTTILATKQILPTWCWLMGIISDQPGAGSLERTCLHIFAPIIKFYSTALISSERKNSCTQRLGGPTFFLLYFTFFFPARRMFLIAVYLAKDMVILLSPFFYFQMSHFFAK